MSKGSNINPDHYKVGGRNRQDVIAAERMKRARASTKRLSARPPVPSTRSKARPSSADR